MTTLTQPVGQHVSANQRAADRWRHALMDNFGTPPIELVSGHGAVVVDADGNEYLDLLGGIAVNALGHAHPAIVEAVTAQVGTLGHVSNFFTHPTVLDLAEKLLEISGFGSGDDSGDDSADDSGRALFCNSGAEANEAAFKMARLTGRPRIIAAEGAFHGRTMGSLAMTGQPAKRAPFEPMPAGVQFVRYGDIPALAAALGADVAAVILEPILGEAGVVPAPDGYLAAARQLTREHGALLIVDEVQTGIARTGEWFAFQHAGIVPDIVTLAKGLGGGLPIGAVLATGDAAHLLKPGQHGSTFAGNPVCAASALAVIATIERDELREHVAQLGKHIVNGIEDLHDPLIAGVRGAGLLLGIMLRQPISAGAVAAARDAGFIVNAPAPDVLRLAPPLILTTEQADGFVAALPQILQTAAAQGESV